MPARRLQSDPAADLQNLEAEQRQQSAGAYGSVDRDRGLFQIPVERAMEIIAGRGEGAFAPLEAPNSNVPFPIRPEAAPTPPNPDDVARP